MRELLQATTGRPKPQGCPAVDSKVACLAHFLVHLESIDKHLRTCLNTGHYSHPSFPNVVDRTCPIPYLLLT